MTRFSDTERVTVPLLAIGPAPLALEPLVSAVAADRTAGDGAVVTFLGLVRNHNQGRRVQYLEYEAYEPLALKAFARIADEAHEALAGRRGWRCTTGPGGSRSAKRASRSSRRRRIAATPTRRAATRSSA